MFLTDNSRTGIFWTRFAKAWETYIWGTFSKALDTFLKIICIYIFFYIFIFLFIYIFILLLQNFELSQKYSEIYPKKTQATFCDLKTDIQENFDSNILSHITLRVKWESWKLNTDSVLQLLSDQLKFVRSILVKSYERIMTQPSVPDFSQRFEVSWKVSNELWPQVGSLCYLLP